MPLSVPPLATSMQPRRPVGRPRRDPPGRPLKRLLPSGGCPRTPPRHGDAEAQCATLFLLTLAHGLTGNPHATVLGEECLAICDAHGAPWSRSYVLWVLGLERWLNGNTHDAIILLQDGLRIDYPTHNLLAVAQRLEVLAWARAREERHELAAQLLGAAQTAFRLGSAPLSGFLGLFRHRDECEAHLRWSIGAEKFAAALRAGHDLTVEQAIARALGRTPTIPSAAHDAHTQPGALDARQEHVPLSRREREVVTVLAEGLTDKQIAARLVVSPRTAEGHVQRILNKLGFTSRTQIVTWAVGHQPAAPESASGPAWADDALRERIRTGATGR
ncbi:helix-turn-helix domain-containing protein [Kitasatospora sp. NPDC001159]